METNCEHCDLRRLYSNACDSHFDWHDCPYECDYAKSMRQKETDRIAKKELLESFADDCDTTEVPLKPAPPAWSEEWTRQ